MLVHLEREIEAIKKKILTLGSMVEERVTRAVQAVKNRDAALGLSVVEGDEEIDTMEVEIEEECLKVLALHQPVAIDLRFLIAVLKINNDLERIGDLAVNIAHRARALADLPPVATSFDFLQMAKEVQQLFRGSLTAFINMDIGLAKKVCEDDEKVDTINRETHQKINENIMRDPEHVQNFTLFLAVSRNLERIADHATNIAEDVIYMKAGEIIRHGHWRNAKIF